MVDQSKRHIDTAVKHLSLILAEAQKESKPDTAALNAMKTEAIPQFRTGLEYIEKAWKAIEALK